MKRIYKYLIGAAIVAMLGYGGAKLLSGPQSWYNVVDFGIKNDSSADITASLQALINFVPAGSVIYFPVGKYRQDGRDTVGNKQIKFLGPVSAMTNNAVTWNGTQNCTIFHGNQTDTAWRIEGWGVTFENLSIQYAGAGTSTGWGIYYHQGNYARMHHTVVSNFGTNMEMKNAAEYVVDDCYFLFGHNTNSVIIADSVNHDNGDGVINNCFFVNSGVAIQNGLNWTSGGGLRLTGNKFNGGFVNCVYAPFQGTIDGQILNNGFENYTGAWFKMVLPSGGSINNLVIAGNYSDGNGIGGHLVLDGSTSGAQLLQGVYIGSNEFYCTGIDTAIVVNKIIGAYIGPNTIYKAKVGIVTLNISSGDLLTDYPNGIQLITESSNSITLRPERGMTASVTIAGNDTLKIASALNATTGNAQASAGPGNGQTFKVIVKQDATGGHNLITQGYGTNYSGGTTGYSVIGLDTRANAVTVVEGYINGSGAATVTNTSRYMESKAIPYMAANNALSEDITNFNYDDTKLMLTGARMKLLPLTKLTAADGQLQYDGSHVYFDIGTTHYQIDQQTGVGFSNPMTTDGDMIYQVGGSYGRLAAAAHAGMHLVSGTSGAISWLDSTAAGGGSGVTTVGTFSGSAQTNGASISGSTITFGPASATVPGMMSTGTQTLGGAKTFGNTILNFGGAGTGGDYFRNGDAHFGDISGNVMIGVSAVRHNGSVLDVTGAFNTTASIFFASTSSSTGGLLQASGNDIYIGNNVSTGAINFRSSANGINAMHLDGANGGAATFGSLTNQGFAQVEAVKTSGAQFSAVYDGTHHTEFTTNSSGNLAIVPSGGTTTITGNLTLGTAGNALNITEGTNGRVGQTTLVSGTKAITISGLTTSSRAFITLVSPSGASLTTACQAVCTANTLTIQADVSAGTINTADASVYNYFVIN